MHVILRQHICGFSVFCPEANLGYCTSIGPVSIVMQYDFMTYLSNVTDKKNYAQCSIEITL